MINMMRNQANVITQKRRSRAVRTAFLALANGILFWLNGCATGGGDFTSSLGFAPLVNRCFVLRQEVFIATGAPAADYWLAPAGEDTVMGSIEKYRAGKKEGNACVIHGVMPAGVHIRIYRLKLGGWTGYYSVLGKVMDGEYMGKTVDVHFLTVVPPVCDDGTPGTWIVDDRFLTSCDDKRREE